MLATSGCAQKQASVPPPGGGTTQQTGESPFSARAEAEYVGSQRCGECHDRLYATWFGTGHAQIVQKVDFNPLAVMGDFESTSSIRTFKKDDIVITHGVQWKQRYIDKDWHVLPAQWNFDTRKWAAYHPDDWMKSDWRKDCAYCHVVGFNTADNTWIELGIGCESCHGPGSAHADKPTIANIVSPARLTRTLAADVCGNCHVRGKSPDGKHSFPVNFRPGQAMGPQNFTPVSKTTTTSWWPDGSIREHRQQYIEWRESQHSFSGIDCTQCHTVHAQGTKFGTKAAPNVLCRTCHPDISTDPVTGHAPMPGAPQHSDCVACHMPPTGKSADWGDERSHRFWVIEPQTTIRLGGGDISKQPNSCQLCHYHAKDDPRELQRVLDSGRKGKPSIQPAGPIIGTGGGSQTGVGAK
jgi:predicted CXXCH cytochrome family protein